MEHNVCTSVLCENNLNKLYINQLVPNSTCLAMPPSPSQYVDQFQDGVLDTGCSKHTLRIDAPTDERQPTTPHFCGTPTGQLMDSNEKALLKHSTFPEPARESHLYNGLNYKSLLSVGQFCDAGYQA